MISIELAPSQLQEALKLIAADKDASITLSEENPDTIGHVHTSQIDADFEYRMRSDTAGTIVFTNEVKRGMYKFVTDDTIGQHLVGLLSKLPPPVEPEPTA